MFSYLREIKHRDLAARRRFVVFATTISAVAIFGIWVPIRVAQWKASSTSVAKATPTPEAKDNNLETAPIVAGDETQNLESASLEASAIPLIATPTPEVNNVETVPAPASAIPTPEASAPAENTNDFPTL